MKIATAHVQGDLIHVTLSETTTADATDFKVVRATLVDFRRAMRDIGFFDVYTFRGGFTEELVLFVFAPKVL